MKPKYTGSYCHEKDEGNLHLRILISEYFINIYNFSMKKQMKGSCEWDK